MKKTISTATRSAVALASLASAYLESSHTIDTINLLTAKGAQCLAFDMVGASVSELNTALAAIKPTIPTAKIKGFDQLLRRHVLPVLTQENKAPFFLYNANNGKKGSFATFHNKPQTLKGKANPKQKTATGKAPLPSNTNSVTVEQLADALPTIKPLAQVERWIADGTITLKELDSMLARLSASATEKYLASAASVASKADAKRKTRKAQKVAGIMADAMTAAREKIQAVH